MIGSPESEPTLESILSTAAAAAGVSARPSSGVRIADLMAAGYLEEGETVRPGRKTVAATAVILGDGRLECLDEAFDTPSAAARRAAGTVAENGWDFWLVERGESSSRSRTFAPSYPGWPPRPGSGPVWGSTPVPNGFAASEDARS